MQLGPPKRERPDTSAIDESSSYHEFAWEFLRRNRFYQALKDGKAGCPPVSDWGFSWHDDVPRHHGLVEEKDYWESYDEGTPPRWAGLDDFAQRLPAKPSLKLRTETVTLRPGQVLVVFDLSGLIYGQSPLDPQLWAAREHLEKISTRPFPKTSFFGKPMHRAVLLRRLKLFDALDAGCSMAEACEMLQYRFRGKPSASPGPFSNMAKSLASGGKKGEPVTTAFEDANAAYELVYLHGYLAQLLGEKSYSLQAKDKERALVADGLINRRKRPIKKSKKQEK